MKTKLLIQGNFIEVRLFAFLFLSAFCCQPFPPLRLFLLEVIILSLFAQIAQYGVGDGIIMGNLALAPLHPVQLQCK